MTNRPITLKEWSRHIRELTGKTLYSQARAANTQVFARTLLEEGIQMDMIEEIILLYVRQLRAVGVAIPQGGAFDMITMSLVDPIASRGLAYSEEESRLLAIQGQTPIQDDLSLFDLEASFTD